MAPARRQFDRLPISVAAAVLETLDAIAENPRRLGKRLALEHEGRWSARRGPYRIIYELVEDDHVVRVVAIGHRRDVYRTR
jgi:mRNA-degrading endonuclease RelE of RelBE toxin-antitoxin system